MCWSEGVVSWLNRLFFVVCVIGMGVLFSWEAPEAILVSKQTPIPIFPKEEGFHPQLVHIPGGRFLVGEVASRREDAHQDLGHRPKKAHIPYDYWMMSTELSIRVAAQLGSTRTIEQGRCMGDCPLSNISWYDAVEYANLLSKKTGLEPCYVIDKKRVRWPKGVACLGYRLPLEEEWEYAAKAGQGNIVYTDGDAALESMAWYKENALQRAHPIAGKTPNSLLLYDMLGNLSEWCWDPWEKRTKTAGRQRVVRGGNWGLFASKIHTEYREAIETHKRSFRFGVRFVRTIPD